MCMGDACRRFGEREVGRFFFIGVHDVRAATNRAEPSGWNIYIQPLESVQTNPSKLRADVAVHIVRLDLAFLD